jgi:hypothetical protein
LPCDRGADVQTTVSLTGRVVRAKWLRCLGHCGRWFWSKDAVNNRMCEACAGGHVYQLPSR